MNALSDIHVDMMPKGKYSTAQLWLDLQKGVLYAQL